MKLRRCELGELCWLGAVSRPDMCAMLARPASRAHSLQGSDVYRINDLAKTVEVWQEATTLKCLSSPHVGQPVRRNDDGEMMQRGGEIHEGTMTLVAWSAAACGHQSAMGKRRLGHVIGEMSSALREPCHIFRRTSQFGGKLVAKTSAEKCTHSVRWWIT